MRWDILNDVFQMRENKGWDKMRKEGEREDRNRLMVKREMRIYHLYHFSFSLIFFSLSIMLLPGGLLTECIAWDLYF